MATYSLRGLLGGFTFAMAIMLAACSDESPQANTASDSSSAATPAGRDTPSLPSAGTASTDDTAAPSPTTSSTPAGTSSRDPASMPPGTSSDTVQPTPTGGLKDVPAPPPVPKWTPPEDMKSVTFLGLTAPKPATWIEHPPQNPMYTATLTVPGYDDENAASIVVFYFGPKDGGTNEANIERWAGQFKSAEGQPVEPIVETLESDGMPITIVELEGQYLGMGAPSHTADQKMISAIIDAPVGKVFIRFVGDKQTVQSNREEFVHLLKNLQRVEEISK